MKANQVDKRANSGCFISLQEYSTGTKEGVQLHNQWSKMSLAWLYSLFKWWPKAWLWLLPHTWLQIIPWGSTRKLRWIKHCFVLVHHSWDCLRCLVQVFRDVIKELHKQYQCLEIIQWVRKFTSILNSSVAFSEDIVSTLQTQSCSFSQGIYIWWKSNKLKHYFPYKAHIQHTLTSLESRVMRAIDSFLLLWNKTNNVTLTGTNVGSMKIRPVLVSELNGQSTD